MWKSVTGGVARPDSARFQEIVLVSLFRVAVPIAEPFRSPWLGVPPTVTSFWPVMFTLNVTTAASAGEAPSPIPIATAAALVNRIHFSSAPGHDPLGLCGR